MAWNSSCNPWWISSWYAITRGGHRNMYRYFQGKSLLLPQKLRQTSTMLLAMNSSLAAITPRTSVPKALVPLLARSKKPKILTAISQSSKNFPTTTVSSNIIWSHKSQRDGIFPITDFCHPFLFLYEKKKEAKRNELYTPMLIFRKMFFHRESKW